MSYPRSRWTRCPRAAKRRAVLRNSTTTPDSGVASNETPQSTDIDVKPPYRLRRPFQRKRGGLERPCERDATRGVRPRPARLRARRPGPAVAAHGAAGRPVTARGAGSRRGAPDREASRRPGLTGDPAGVVVVGRRAVPGVRAARV